MKTLDQICIPRKSVFDSSRRDDVLDLTDLTESNINASVFLEENYLTDGMKNLLREAFRSFTGKSASGVIKLTQAMGGGKTHCMITLGLLAQHPELRKKVMGEDYKDEKLGPVKVISFTGRQSDIQFGIWGSLADQLGKKDTFKDYYSPLRAPGQDAWVNLLKGEPLLILLDELAPYLENARSILVGNSDLSVVTVTALSNLLAAIGKKELSNVCIVISDLRATYESGSEGIHTALKNLENEIGRKALNIEPVELNTDEVYHILKKRLFDKTPDEKEIQNIAEGYAQAIKEAGQMDITHFSPDKFIRQIRESYPFHPAIKDLFARFRENPGFQQTRGLIRFMRLVVSNIYSGGIANSRYLIHIQDIDLNDSMTLAEVNSINPNLENAVSHDIASKGYSVAEILDHQRGGSDAQEVCKLLMVSSLANIQNAVLGLAPTEVMAYICAPGRDITKLPEIIDTLETRLCWYLHRGRDGRLFFKKNQNLVAKLRSTADAYSREISLKELKSFLTTTFSPEKKDCYQEVQVLPAVDDIKVLSDKVKLILYEPFAGGLHSDLKKFYDDLDYKNRVLFLSGQRETMDSLIDIGKEHKAIEYILEEMDSEGIRIDDPQRKIALDIKDKTELRLLSATRETFTRLIYPQADRLLIADFMMNFTNNEYRGEQQIRDTLKNKQKFTEDITGDTFRKKCEKRLFTQQSMLWKEVKIRSAINTEWQWQHPDALDSLKTDMISKDQWREEDKYINKGPFPKPFTDVQFQQLHRDEDTGEATLKIIPVHGDVVFYDTGGDASSGSAHVENLNIFKTSEMEVSFLCVDSTKQHEMGEPRKWKNQITMKKRLYGDNNEKHVELKSAPSEAVIKYTIDGSNPHTSGRIYSEPFTVKKDKGTRMILTIAEKNGIFSDQTQININWKDKVEPPHLKGPVIWKCEHKQMTTKESFEFISRLRKFEGKLLGPSLAVVGENWIELTVAEKVSLDATQIDSMLNALRSIYNIGEVSIETRSLGFPSIQHLTDFVADEKKNINYDEVIRWLK